MNNEWLDNLRKRMEAHEESSPEGLWEDIEQIIVKEDFIQSSSRRKKLLFWGKRLGTVAAVILVILFIGDSFLKEYPKKPLMVTQKKQKPGQFKNNFFTRKDSVGEMMEGDDKQEVISSNKNKLVALAALISKESLDKKKGKTLIDKVTESEDFRNEAQKENNRNSSIINIKKKANEANSISTNRNNNKVNLYRDLLIKNRNKSTRWETSVYASNISSSSTKKYNGYGSLVSKEIPQKGDNYEPVLGDDSFGNILLENKYKQIYTDVKHRQPITMGISFNYNLDKKWSIASGLTYTILSSELRSGSDNYYYTSEQTLHNIGMPLNINYNVYKSKKISIYLSGGGLVEKNVSGRLTTNYIIDNKIDFTKKDKISIDQLQWSLNTSAGIQYNFSKKIGLYIEPGVNYYFKNKSEIETIYKEKSVNFSLKFGFRFSFRK